MEIIFAIIIDFNTLKYYYATILGVKEMENFIKEMDEAMVQLCNYADVVDKKLRDYGSGDEITPREMHLIETINNHPKQNASSLAAKNGLLKGTFSKIVKNLEKKGLIEKYQNEPNRKEIFYRLTDSGLKAYEGHYRFHEEMSKKTYEYFSHYTDEEKKIIMEFINHYSNYLQEYLK